MALKKCLLLIDMALEDIQASTFSMDSSLDFMPDVYDQPLSIVKLSNKTISCINVVLFSIRQLTILWCARYY